MVKKEKALDTHEFEKEHFPCAKEWWCVEGFFTTIENKKRWSFKADLYQGIGKDKSIWSVYSITIFDIDNNKTFCYESVNESLKLESLRDCFFVKYGKSHMKGSFPTYQMYFSDPINKIELDLKYHTESLPYWVAQQITNGWLPWGLGYFRYGFIPKNEIKGTMTINNQKLTIGGKGYFEHIWGDFSFFYLSPSKRSIKKTISTYAKFIGRWIQNLKIPKSIMFCTDNRSPGYDWAWALLDNGWSIFYGNIMSWIMEGPATGILILSKDGIKYSEFSNIHFKYNKMKYLEKYDFYYPLELEITAIKGQEKLYLHIKNVSESVEGLTEAANEKSLLGFIICQIPSKIDGYYFNGGGKNSITGSSKIEIHRLLRIFGHNSLKINFIFSKNRFGILSSFNSHYLGKKLDINLQFLPKPKLKIRFNRVYKSQLKKV